MFDLKHYCYTTEKLFLQYTLLHLRGGQTSLTERRDWMHVLTQSREEQDTSCIRDLLR